MCFTHAGIGMVRVCPAFPLRSTIARVNQNQTFRHEVEGGYLWSPSSIQTESAIRAAVVNSGPGATDGEIQSGLLDEPGSAAFENWPRTLQPTLFQYAPSSALKNWSAFFCCMKWFTRNFFFRAIVATKNRNMATFEKWRPAFPCKTVGWL
jgi:hypothetical protein